MNFEQLKIIVTIGEEKSFSRTANRLNMTTSAVSQAISSIEKELGIKLFDRSKSGSFTTEKGQYVLREAVQILSIQDEIFRYSNDKENKKLRIKIGVIPGMSIPLIKTLKKLKKNYEFLETTIEEHDTEILLKGLRDKKYNFAILSFSDTIRNHNITYKIHQITEGDFCFMVNQNSHLAEKKQLTFEDIIKENIAIYEDKFLKNYISYIEGYCNQKADIFIKCNDINFILNSVEENIAISPTLSYLANEYSEKLSKKIKIINVEQKETFINPSLWFLEVTDFSGQPLAKDFLKYFKQEILRHI